MPTAGESFITGPAADALRLINTTAAPVFLTGKAGTGKTTFLKSLGLHTRKNFLVVAPTGIAALNAGGVTIHSQFRLPFGVFLPDSNEPISGQYFNQRFLAENSPLDRPRRQLMRSIDLLVIDEASMLRADLLDAIDYRLKSARGIFSRPFGGVQLLFIGDLYQLPPVVRREDEQVISRHYPTPWFFEAHALRRERLIYIELDRVYRQQDDRFIGILNNLRHNRLTDADLGAINDRYRPDITEEETRETITLTTHNAQADTLNQRALDMLPGKIQTCKAVVTGDFPESMYPVALSLVLKVGAQVMFTRNDAEGKAYFNGRIARVTEMDDDAIMVRFQDTGEPFMLKTETWENKRYAADTETGAIREEVIGTFEQLPLRLAWAITIHKSQGLTFDRAIIDPGRAFADGQVYVALSRLRSLEGLTLRAPLRPQVVSTDPNVVNFSSRNHQPGQLDEVLQHKQREFVGQTLLQAFDIDNLIRVAGAKRKEESLDLSMQRFPEQLAELIGGESAQVSKIKQQLVRMLDEDRNPELLELLKTGSSYLITLFWTSLERLFRHQSQIQNSKASQNYRNVLTELDQLLMLKLYELEQAACLVPAIRLGQALPDLSGLRGSQASKRLSLMNEARMALSLERTPKKKPKKTTQKVKGSSIETSISMYLAGKEVEAIAAERGMVVGTILSHLAAGVASGRIRPDSLVEEQCITAVRAAARSLSEVTASGVYRALDGKYGYGVIRIVLAIPGLLT